MATELSKIISEFDFRSKNNYKIRHLFLPAFAKIAGLFKNNYYNNFQERTTTIVGQTIYMPEEKFQDFLKTRDVLASKALLYLRLRYLPSEDWNEPIAPLASDIDLTYPLERLLRHEYVHRLQRERDGSVLFTLKYLLSKKARLRYELEAYYITALYALVEGFITDELEATVETTRKWLIKILDGDMYFFKLEGVDALLPLQCASALVDIALEVIKFETSLFKFTDKEAMLEHFNTIVGDTPPEKLHAAISLLLKGD